VYTQNRKNPRVCLVTPQVLGDGFFGEHAILLDDEENQQVILLLCERKHFLVDSYLELIRQNFDFSGIISFSPLKFLRRMMDLIRALSSARWNGFVR
jgi:hypothetical protein